MSSVPSEYVQSTGSQRPFAHARLASSLDELLQEEERLRNRGRIGLREVFEEAGLLDPATLDALQELDPRLLEGHSHELVARRLISGAEHERVLAMRAGVPEADILRFPIDHKALAQFGPELSRSHRVWPLGVVGNRLFVATSRPVDEALRHHFTLICNQPVEFVWAAQDAIDEMLSRVRLTRVPNAQTMSQPVAGRGVSIDDEMTLGSGATKASAARVSATQDAEPIDALVSHALSEVDLGFESDQSETLNQASSMVRLVKRIIEDAQTAKASDIHVESNPGEEPTRIRFRRDGDLETYCELPSGLHSALVSRIKIMARLDIAEKRRPQDGKINFAEFGGVALELRVAVVPTHDNFEDVVMRLLVSTRPLPLEQLGLTPRDISTIHRMSARTFGLILAAGPTGSGKTTTLHSLLREVNTTERKIWTAEDPIEITHPGLRQVQMNAKIGLNFASAMRSFLRADPDIIMIGEIRDAETAKVAIEASLTGHLVLSTLHTNSAAESVVRLLDLGMDALNFADSLVGIIAQRLVRGLCPKCKQVYSPAPAEVSALVAEYCHHNPVPPEEARTRLFGAAGVSEGHALQLYRAKGCPSCAGKGYKGRVGVYEILESSSAIRALIENGGRPHELFECAVREGMRSLRHDALEKFFAGRLDLVQARIAYM